MKVMPILRRASIPRSRLPSPCMYTSRQSPPPTRPASAQHCLQRAPGPSPPRSLAPAPPPSIFPCRTSAPCSTGRRSDTRWRCWGPPPSAAVGGGSIKVGKGRGKGQVNRSEIGTRIGKEEESVRGHEDWEDSVMGYR